MSIYNIVLSTKESTVVTEYEPQTKRSDVYQNEVALEAEFIKMLKEQGYEYVNIKGEKQLITNLRKQLELFMVIILQIGSGIAFSKPRLPIPMME